MLTILLVALVALASANPVNLDINDGACGEIQTSTHIVGGVVTSEYEYPWMTAMYYRGSFRCGGSLIKGTNGFFILTAAHCTVNTQNNQWEMRLGLHTLSQTGQRISVSNRWDHPQYSSSTLDNDVAIFQLSSAPTINNQVKPGCVPINDFTPGSTSWVSGWGATSEGGSSSSTLRHVSKPILTHSACTSYLGSGNYNSGNMLCAGFEAGGADACQGDSGGPFMTQVGGRWEITGIVSWGFGCARPERPGVYHNSFSTKDWISGIING